MSFGSAFRRSWLIVLVCVLVCTGAGVAVGLERTPEYHADSQLLVGTFDVRTLAIPGFVTAATQLADAYSRLVVSDQIVLPVARRTRLSPSEVRERLSATAIPETVFLRIRATGSSRDDALRLVRAATAVTSTFVNKITRADTQAGALLRRFQAAVAHAQSLEAENGRLKGLARSGGQTISKRRLRRAAAEAETARLLVTTLAQLYSETRAGGTGGAQVNVLTAEPRAGNDRNSVLQRLIFLGLVAGLVLGAGLGALRQARLMRAG